MGRKEAVVLNALNGLLTNENIFKSFIEGGSLTIDNGEEIIKMLRVQEAFYICHTNSTNPNDVILGIFYPANKSGNIYSSLESQEQESMIFDIRHLIAVLIIKGKSLEVDEKAFINEIQGYIENGVMKNEYYQKPKLLEFIDN